MSDETSYRCHQCAQPFSGPADVSGQTGICPHCGQETLLDVGPATATLFLVWKDDQQSGPFDQETIQQMLADGRIKRDTLVCVDDGSIGWTPARDLFMTDGSAPDSMPSVPDDTFSESSAVARIILGSGTELKVKAIWLYDEQALFAIRQAKEKAFEKLKGVSSGLSPIGSLGWVMATSAVISVVEGAMSLSSEEEGRKLLTKAIKMAKDLRNKGVICQVGKIENIDLPNPGLWRVYSPKIRTSFIHNGDEFLTVQKEDGSMCSIRWDAVESYACER